MMIMLDKKDIADIISFLHSIKISIPSGHNMFHEIRNSFHTVNRLDVLIQKLEVELNNNKPVDTVIDRLLEQRVKIQKELKSKYMDDILETNMTAEKLAKLFNEKEPALMAQLFFLDIELKNLGYDVEQNGL